VVEREGIEVSEDELLDSLRAAARGQGGGREPTDKALRRTLKRLRAQGAEEALLEDIAMRKAVDLLAERAKPIAVEQAKAREKLWTPGKEEQEAGPGRIWTPGS
jgi:trigger factor